MIPLGLDTADQRAYLQTVVGSHSMRTLVQLTNMDGDRLGDLTGMLIDGQVDVNHDSSPTRTCSLSLIDVHNRLTFDSDAPDEGAIYMDRMVRVHRGALVPGVGWVDVPVFLGPVTKMDRDGDVVNIEAGGKELLAQGAIWKPMTIRRGHRKTWAAQHILAQGAGETRFSFPESNLKMPHNLSLSRESTPWAAASAIANGMNRHLFYDGRGVCWMRPRGTNVVWTFRDGDGGSVTSTPQISYSTEDLRNIVWVKGGVPTGKKQAISVTATAPRSHPLSPWRLGRHLRDGTLVPRWLLETVENTTLRTAAEAREVARNRVEASLLESVDVSFDSLPLPFFDPLDLARLDTTGAGMVFRIRSFSIPLGATEGMSVGANKRVSVRPRRARRP